MVPSPQKKEKKKKRACFLSEVHRNSLIWGPPTAFSESTTYIYIYYFVSYSILYHINTYGPIYIYAYTIDVYINYICMYHGCYDYIQQRQEKPSLYLRPHTLWSPWFEEMSAGEDSRRVDSYQLPVKRLTCFMRFMPVFRGKLRKTRVGSGLLTGLK